MALPPVAPPFGGFIGGIVDFWADSSIARRNMQARRNEIDRLNLETRRIQLEKSQLRNQYKGKSSFMRNVFNPQNIWSGKRVR